ncbi:MAG: hypothetical protein HY066_02080 [Betaproteobacteria bacterium]|nr:hypothetical protein [Betaproteobacteria bacterium]
MSNNLIEQADALMRRRVFVAGANSEAAPTTDSASDDVPVLTDVVAAQAILPQADAHIRQLLAERQVLLTREIETWLDEQLPQLVIRAMDGITDHLVALLANRARDDLLPRLEAALQAPDEAGSSADSTES